MSVWVCAQVPEPAGRKPLFLWSWVTVLLNHLLCLLETGLSFSEEQCILLVIEPSFQAEENQKFS